MPEPPADPPGQQTILDRVDLKRSLSREEYDEQLAALQDGSSSWSTGSTRPGSRW